VLNAGRKRGKGISSPEGGFENGKAWRRIGDWERTYRKTRGLIQGSGQVHISGAKSPGKVHKSPEPYFDFNEKTVFSVSQDHFPVVFTSISPFFLNLVHFVFFRKLLGWASPQPPYPSLGSAIVRKWSIFDLEFENRPFCFFLMFQFSSFLDS